MSLNRSSVFRWVGFLSLVSSLEGCISLEGAIYQESALEQKECRKFAKDKYTELTTYMQQSCFLHHQMEAMTVIDNDEGMPALEKSIYQVCMHEDQTTLESILDQKYGAKLDGDIAGVSAGSAECQSRQALR